MVGFLAWTFHRGMMLSDAEFQSYIDELSVFLRIPSVSTDPAFSADVRCAAEWVRDQLSDSGLPNVQLMETAGYPVVFASYEAGPQYKTVLFYGHYDVQPADPVALWESPPFSPVIRDGHLIARGVSDDKGQIFCHFKALKRLFAAGNPKLNINVLIEGEEEIGSPSLKQFVMDHQPLLAADILLVSDTPMYAKNRPSICTHLRGLVYFQLDVVTAKTDLHSGQHGGAVPNAIQVLIDLLSQLKNKDGEILIPGFYDDVDGLSSDLQEETNGLGFDDRGYEAQLGAKGLCGERGYSTLERRWYRPCLDINGIWGGYTGEGSKTVIPACASAKFSCRLVANQDPVRIAEDLQHYISSLIPSYSTVEVRHLTKGAEADPMQVSSNGLGISEALAALESVFGVAAVLQGEGGSIPVVAMLQNLLQVSPVLMGFNLPEDKIHAPNEQFLLENIRRGILAAELFWQLVQK